MKKKYPELCDLVVLKLANNTMAIMNLMINRHEFRIYKEQYYKVAKILNKYFNKSIKIKEYPRNVKILLIANKISPLLYKNIITRISKVG